MVRELVKGKVDHLTAEDRRTSAEVGGGAREAL